jgi:hypothetical protein
LYRNGAPYRMKLRTPMLLQLLHNGRHHRCPKHGIRSQALRIGPKAP